VPNSFNKCLTGGVYTEYFKIIKSQCSPFPKFLILLIRRGRKVFGSHSRPADRSVMSILRRAVMSVASSPVQSRWTASTAYRPLHAHETVRLWDVKVLVASTYRTVVTEYNRTNICGTVMIGAYYLYNLIPGRGEIYLFSIASRPVLGPTQPPIEWGPGGFFPRGKATWVWNAEVNNGGAIPPVPNMSFWHNA
jgi:hypothetical protein